MKLFTLLLAVIFFIGFSSAAFSNAGDTSSFSGTFGYQNYNPSYTSAYSSTDINAYWPQLAEDIANGKCYGNTDFLVMIPPAGCTPSVVRTDLLAEQNVPVFCQLESAKVNPLIKVSSIKSISFRGKYPDEIAGVSYYPSRAAINSYTTLLGSPVVNNIGYVVIILKKQSNESASPKNISGNLTATLYYDAEKAYGVGSSEFYLKTMSDDEWEANKYLQGFWQGRGLLKLVDVQDDQATIQVLSQDGSILRTETLNTGKTGSLFYFPGFYCRAGLQLKLNDIDSPEDSVIMSVDGVQMEARKGTTLGNTGCKVTSLNVLAGDTGTVKVSCKGKTFDLSLLSLYKANVTVDGVSNSYEMAQRISTAKGNYYFVYGGMNKRQIDTHIEGSEFVVLVKSDIPINNKFYSELAKNIDNTFSNQIDVELTLEKFKSAIAKNTAGIKSSDVKILFTNKGGDVVDNVEFNGLLTSENEQIETNLSENNKELAANYFKQGDAVLQTLLDEYSALSNTTGTNYGETGLYEEITLLDRLQQKGMNYGAKKIELMKQFLELYPESSLAASVENQLNLAQRADLTNAYKSVFSNNEYHTIGISQFKPADRNSKSFELAVNNRNVRNNATNELLFYEGDTINLSSFSPVRDANDYLIVKSITSKEVTFEYYSTKDRTSGKVNELFDANFKLSFSEDSNKAIEPKKLNSGTTKNEAYSLYLSDVHVDKTAHVSIVSDLKTTSEANFTFNIGIEQRTIKLSPEKAKTQADELNKTIKEWEDKNAKLGKLVESWKAVCLATNLVFNVKNLISGFTGQSTARQEVMQVYKVKCRAAVANGTYPTVDACYSSYSDEINSDVSAYTGAIEGINDDITRKYHNNLSEFQASNDCSFKASNGEIVTASRVNSWSEARQCLLYVKLSNSSSITEGLRNEIKADTSAQLGNVAGNMQANKEFETLKSQLPDLLKDSYFTTAISNRNVKVTSYKTLDKSALREVISGSPLAQFEGNDSLGIATTYYGNTWYLLVMGGGNAVTTYNFVLNNKQLTQVVASKDNGVSYNENVAQWDVDVTSNRKCSYNYTNPTVRFYESSDSKGLPAYVPIDVKEGWYVFVPSSQGTVVTQTASSVLSATTTGKAVSGYTDAGEVTFLYLCNVGPNGREDLRQGDDICQSFNTNNNNFEGFSGCSLSSSDIRTLINKARSSIKYVAGSYKSGVRRISVPNVGDNIEVEPGMMSSNSNNFVCQDFFTPDECKLMYNVCDPVICPPSRCNFGGKIAVPNVIQSGILGSAVLCLKNFVGFGGDVYIPVCLTGIHAGIEGYISILKAQQKCLNEYANSGKHVGICDEMTAIYKCEFFWRQISPLMKNIIPSLAELVYTSRWGGQANGGEYATFQQSWDNMQSSIDYFKNTYASTSFTAYKFGNVEEMGSTYCQNFLGTSLPTSAEAIDSLLKPESPAQFYGTFSSIPYTTATVPSTSQYKVFYHIYAGTDIGATYQIYLKNPPSLSYYTIPSQVFVASGYLTKGEQVSESKDFTAPTGYKEMCLIVNDQEECGFTSVSTDFAVDVVNDLYVKEQGGANNITTEDECISGSSSMYSLLNLNVQEGVDNAINPDISLLGITRVCATQNPGTGKESSNWKSVGYCGNKNLTCWLDQQSVQNAQKVLKNVGSISEAIEVLAVNSTSAIVSDDQQTTAAKLASLKTNISKFKLSNTTVKGGDIAIDSAINGLLTQARNVFDNARLDLQKAEALYLQMQIYVKVVKNILDVKDSEGEKTVSSSVVVAPAADSTISSTGTIKTAEEEVVERIQNDYTFRLQSGNLYQLKSKSTGKVETAVTVGEKFSFEEYKCIFNNNPISLTCELDN